MFGFAKRQAVRDVTTALGQLLGQLEAAGIGQPAGFWRDPYALGFLYGTAAILLHERGQGRYRSDTGGTMCLTAIRNVAGSRGDAATASLMDYMRSNDPTYMAAMGIGADLAMFVFDRPVEGKGMDIEGAIAHGVSLGYAMDGKNDSATIRKYAYAHLMDRHWLQAVGTRLA